MGKLRKIFYFFLRLLRNLVCLVFFCEFVIYYIVIFQCNWPKLKTENINDGIKALILADTHMLGPFRGHPIDRLRREWQMKRSFQASIQLFHPDVVFILGDVFDEGNWVNDKQYESYVERFKTIFYVPPSVRLYALHGNHDINFHYQMHPHLIDRFNRAFNTSCVRLIREKKTTAEGVERTVSFVSINSMALERDGCRLCNDAEVSIKSIGDRLNKSKSRGLYSQPIVLQHFPTFRKSDEECFEKSPVTEKFREKWDTLSLDSTKFIAKTLEPRAYFSGHSHHYCHLTNAVGADEFTVASFNWRNLNHPSFLLAIFTPKEFSTSKCALPRETTVIAFYVIGCLLSLIFAVVNCNFSKLSRRFKKNDFYDKINDD